MEGYVKYPETGVLPVIHLRSNEQAVHMAGTAQELGAAGVFLIDHKQSTWHDPAVLLEAYTQIHDSHPNLWIGMNCLTSYPEEILQFAENAGVDGVWVDNAAADQKRSGASEKIAEIRGRKQSVFFGGLAMKGSGYIEDPIEAGAYIHDNLSKVDVAVTSGPGTGQACPPERLQAIRLASLDAKLAIASGVDVGNVAQHARLVDYILVASSVETYSLSGVFIEPVLRELIEKDTEARLEAI